MAQGNILVKILRRLNIQMNYGVTIPDVISKQGEHKEIRCYRRVKVYFFLILFFSKINEYKLRSEEVN